MGDPRISRMILVAEADAAIATVTREVLQREGYRVDVAPTRYAVILAGTEGIPLADDDPAHWWSVAAVRAAASGTLVVIFSAHHPSAFSGYRERGFAGLLGRPLDLDGLLATVGARVAPGGATRCATT